MIDGSAMKKKEKIIKIQNQKYVTSQIMVFRVTIAALYVLAWISFPVDYISTLYNITTGPPNFISFVILSIRLLTVILIQTLKFHSWFTQL